MFLLLLFFLVGVSFSGSIIPPVLPPMAPYHERGFVIKAFLEEGSFGQVFLVEDNISHIPYAVKRVLKSTLTRRRKTDDMNWEIATHSAVPDHPNIVKFKKWYSDSTNFYIFMEYCSDGDLFDLLEKNKYGLPESDAKRYAWDIALGLKHLHDRNIIHRDLKTENIFLDIIGTAKIGDFGYARIVQPGEVFHEQVGTVDYWAPEISSRDMSYSFPADIWAFGVLSFELLFGEYPEWVDGMVRFPRYKHLSLEAKDFVDSLLVADPGTRPMITTVLEHPWFDAMRNRSNDGNNEIENSHDQSLSYCCTVS